MGKRLYDIYMDRPGNYIVSGAGGIGKTTQLLNIMHEMLKRAEQGIADITYIPVYIRVKDLNTVKIDAEILYNIIKGFFNHKVNTKAIDEMFEKSIQTHRFLIMIDGLNELNNYITEGQSVLYYIINNITGIKKHTNVHFIITLRDEELINMDKTFEDFSFLKIERLTTAQIDEYLREGDNVLSLESHLRDILSIPMLLRAFKDVYSENPEKAVNLSTKYALLHEWLSLDTIYKSSELKDIEDDYRCRVVDEVLPLFAFKVELEMLKLNSTDSDSEAVNYETLLEETLEALKITGDYKKHILNTIIHTSLLIESNHTFSHDLIREYLAVYCLVNHTDKVSKENVQLMFERLIYFFSGDDKDEDKIKQKLYLDFGELIYGATQNETSLIDILSKYDFEESERNETTYRFYFGLAGVFEDLSERELAYRIGWKAIKLFPEVENHKSDYEKGFEFNWLYYCVNKYKEDNEHDPYYLIENAKSSLEKVATADRPQEYDELYAFILSNTGSHYVSPYCHDPSKAIEWHSKCLEYRKNKSLTESLIQTYRTLMTDYYYLGRNGNKKAFVTAYDYYREAIKSTSNVDTKGIPINRLSQITDKNNIPMDIVLRAMGNEILILKNVDKADDIKQLKQEIIEELPSQIDHVYTKATTSRRHNYEALRDLIEKLNDLLSWNEINNHLELKSLIEEYKNKEL